MAPSAGHLHKLVVRNVKLIKTAWKQASQHLQSRLPPSFRQASSELEPLYARVGPRQSGPVAYLRQSKGRWYTTRSALQGPARNYTTSARGVKYDKASFPKSQTANYVRNLTGRTPFASTLRPNLTGGALGRTAGGYGFGSGRTGGARYFSHGPAAPAEVIQNVSQAIRAFCISGNKAQFNGVNPHNGEKRYRAVTALQDETSRKISSLPKATPGSYIDFSVNPTITALTPLSVIAGYASASENQFQAEVNLNTSGLLDILSADFSRALKDLAAVLNDLKSLSSLGDLPITYRSNSCLRVHFPGCDAETVENLCHELGVKRGVVTQDEDFDSFAGTEIALLFPFAPSSAPSDVESHDGRVWDRDKLDWRDMPLFPVEEDEQDDFSTRSNSGLEVFDIGHSILEQSPPEGYGSMESASGRRPRDDDALSDGAPLEYHDFEGIYRFIELCDGARR